MVNLTFPVIIFGSMLAILLGALVHLIAGGKLLRLIFSIVFAWVGFWMGNFLAARFGANWLQYGQVSYAPALIGSLALSLFGYWISGENRSAEE